MNELVVDGAVGELVDAVLVHQEPLTRLVGLADVLLEDLDCLFRVRRHADRPCRAVLHRVLVNSPAEGNAGACLPSPDPAARLAARCALPSSATSFCRSLRWK